MEVEDGLSGARTDIDDGAIAVLNPALVGDLRRHELAAPDQFGVFAFGFFQAGDVFPGNNENVRGALWIEVFESENVIVFVDLLGRHLAAQKAAKKAISHNFIFFWGGIFFDLVGLSRFPTGNNSRYVV
jgi:hypothetical protein